MQNATGSSALAGRHIDLNDLRIFAYVGSLASFSLAADALQIHKSSVSRSISRLEALLGTPLLQRTTRKVLLTQRGFDLRQRCVEMLSCVNETIGNDDPIPDTAPQQLAAPRRAPSPAVVARIQVRLGAGRGKRQPEVGRGFSVGSFESSAASC